MKASLAIARRLAADEPAGLVWRREPALAHLDVARVLDAQGRSDAALEAYEAALAIAEDLAKAAPSDVDAQRDLLMCYADLGQLQERQGRRPEAQRSYCYARVVVVALIGLEPGKDEWRERRTWVEERLRATQDGAPAPC